jgi:hypothetical protein
MSELITADHATEQGHWYDQQGNCAYEIVGKNGKTRNTTLRDAKTLNLVPSTTTIIRCAAKEGLQNWIIDQNILAALSLPRVPDETDDQFMARIKQDAKEQSKKASEKGTFIHAMVQSGFEGRIESDEALSYYEPARKCLYEATGQGIWECEKSFSRDGYGGKCDLHKPLFLIDIKSKNSSLDNLKTWEEQWMQLAAYRYGLQLDGARGFILYINYQGECRLIEVSPTELEKGWKMFSALKNYWYAKSGLEFTPSL